MLNSTTTVLLFLGLVIALFVIRQRRNTVAAPPSTYPKDTEQSQTYSAERIARVLGPRGAAEDAQPRAADKAFTARLLSGMVAQVNHEQGMVEARGKEPVSIRLVPKVPVDNSSDARAWLGGAARLPDAMTWPEIDGEPLQLLTQIDCSLFPSELWDGLGPRSGWLAIFLAPKSYKPLVLQFNEAGRLRESPAILADSNMVGLDMSSSRSSDAPLPVPNFPRWPVELVPVEHGENDPRRTELREISHKRYGECRDMAPEIMPFDWDGALVLIDMVIAAVQRRLPSGALPAFLSPDRLAALEAKIAEAEETPDKILDMRTNLAEQHAMVAIHDFAREHGPAVLEQLQAVRSNLVTIASAQPFSAAAVGPIIEELKTLSWMHKSVPPLYRDGKKLSSYERFKEGVKVTSLPLTTHAPYADLWVNRFANYLQDQAKHVYTRDPHALPEPLRSSCELIWKALAPAEMGGMGHVPWGYVHQYDGKTDITLLELPSSHLMNWQFGDVNHLVLTMKKADLVAGKFDAVTVQVSN